MEDPVSREVAILIFDEVEVLDFAGPFEVFSIAGGRNGGSPPFRPRLVAPDRRTVSARNGFRVEPHRALDEVASVDVLVLPGGFGTRALIGDEGIRSWIRSRVEEAQMTLTVCTGSLLLADAGLLAGKRATTHFSAYDTLRRLAPEAAIEEGARWVDNGSLITAAGVSAGIEGALHVVARLCGRSVADEAAEYIEYPWWQASAGGTPHP